MKDSVTKLPPAKDIVGPKVSGADNMHYFFGHKDVKQLNVSDFSKTYGDFRDQIKDTEGKGLKNMLINTPYLRIGGKNVDNSKFRNTVSLNEIMIPAHARKDLGYASIKQKIESKGVKVIELDTPPSVLNYMRESVLDAVDRRGSKNHVLVLRELEMRYPKINNPKDRAMQFLKDENIIPKASKKDFKSVLGTTD